MPIRSGSVRLNLSSQMFAIFVTAAGQLLLTPILIRTWGIELFGVWAVIVAIPYALQVVDFGIGVSVAPKVHSLAHNDDHESANSLFGQAITVTTLVGLVSTPLIATVGWVALGAVPADLTSYFSRFDGAVVMLSVIGYFLVGLYTSIFNSVFRTSAYQWAGSLIYDAGRIFEFMSVGVVALAGYGIPVAIASMFLFRVVFGAVSYLVLHRVMTHLRFRLAPIRLIAARDLIIGGLKSSSLAISTVASVQLPVLLAGFFISPERIGLFVAARTVFRCSIQLVSAYVRSIIPVLLKARLQLGDAQVLPRAQKSVIISLLFATGLTILLSLWIGDIFRIWTGHDEEFSIVSRVALGVMSILHLFWTSFAMLLIYTGIQGVLYRYLYAGVLLSGGAVSVFILMPSDSIFVAALLVDAVFAFLTCFGVHHVRARMMPECEQ